MIDKLTIALVNQLKDSIVLTAQTVTALEHRLKQLPDVMVDVVAIATQQESKSSIEAVRAWLNPVLQWRQVPITKLCNREYEMLIWMEMQGLLNREELLQTFLERGLTRVDLETLKQQIQETTLPEVLAVVEWVVAIDIMVNEISSSLRTVFMLLEGIRDGLQLRNRISQTSDIAKACPRCAEQLPPKSALE